MGANSVGEIALDLVANGAPLSNQINGLANKAGGQLTKAFKGVGIAVGAAFAVDKVVNFTKECINLGSNLKEVQNVVDVTYGAMNRQVNAFAKGAIGNYGLSETMAKKYMGTFGAMSKAFGFTTQQAYDMSAALTGLSGDIASFYNIGQDEAYTKLKSVFSGETETLKDLGIVMTQAALDQYALANGYGKTTAKMTEQEKVALRFAFVQKQLALATGDFMRTQDGWANQTRVLTLRWQQFKATIGQGLINLFTPLVKVLNSVLAKLQAMADAFLRFTEMISGKKSQASGMGSLSGDIADATGSMGDLQDVTNGVGDSADESAKKIKKSVMGFDQLNLLSDPEKEETTGNTNIPSVPAVDTGSLDEVLQESENKFTAYVQRLKDLFKAGWEIGLNGNNLDGIKGHLNSIKNTLKEIFLDPGVQQAAQNLIDTFVFNFGKITGSMASIGISIAEGLIGGVDFFLTKDKDFLKQKLISIFNVTADIFNLAGDWFAAIADVFTVFKSDAFKKIVGFALSIGSTILSTGLELFLKVGRDLFGALTKPFIDNKDKIKEAILNTFEPIAYVFGKLAEVVQDFAQKVVKTYDEHFKPLFDAIGVGLSTIFGVVLDVYNNYIVPVLEGLGEKMGTFFDSSLKPMLDKMLTMFGKLGDMLLVLWQNVIVPIITFLINTLGPVLAPIIQFIGEFAIMIITAICDFLGQLFDAISGILDFLTGVFTGNWQLAWEGILNFLGGIVGAINVMLGGFLSWFVDFFGGGINSVLEAIKGFFGQWGENLSNIIEGVKGFFSALIQFFQGDFLGGFQSVFNAAKSFFQGIFGGFPGFAQEKINAVKDWVMGIVSQITFNGIYNSFRDSFSAIYDFCSNVMNGIKGLIDGIISACSSAIEAIKNMLSAKNNANNQSRSSIPKASSALKQYVPRLATGGYVKANTPRLAMIGDNKTQGEIVSPENKMLEVMMKALQLFASQNGNKGGGGSNAAQFPDKIDLTLNVGGQEFITTIIDGINDRSRRQGRSVIIQQG